MDLNELTPEEIVELGYMLNEEMEKEASEYYEEDEGYFDLNELSAEEIVELGYLLNDEMEKEASEYYEEDEEYEEDYFDLNELDVEDFISLAAAVEDEMEKEASMARMRAGYGRAKKAVMDAPGKVKSHYKRRYQKAMSAAKAEAGTREGPRTFRNFGRKTSIQNTPSRKQVGKHMGRQFSPEIAAAGATVSLGALMAARRGES